MIPYIEQLMLEKLSGCISEEDDAQLKQLIKQHPELEGVLKGMQEQLNQPEAQAYLSKLDEAVLWEENRHRFSKRKSIKWWYAAAGILLVTGSSLFYFKQRPTFVKPALSTPTGIVLQLANGQQIDLSDTTQALMKVGGAQLQVSAKSLQYNAANATADMPMNVLRVPAGKDYKLVLADGTEVWMNAKSEIRFPMAFNGKTREVTVNGEAYFSVKQDPVRPFIVHAGDVSVDVLGTAFNINTYSSVNPRIALASGKVALKSKNGEQVVQLSPGYEAVYNQQFFSIDAFDKRNTLGWMEGKYYFRHATLREIGDVINRWFDIEVVFENTAVSRIDLTGILTKQDGLGDFLDNLTKTTAIKYELKAGVLTFR
ncbi:FecR domain-containing protein [Chitinophaga sp.]|uniref:FecR family protein n=1 Tax=Chitinophaga sp. TaxID=1869181 RepID=UPI0031E0DB9B